MTERSSPSSPFKDSSVSSVPPALVVPDARAARGPAGCFLQPFKLAGIYIASEWLRARAILPQGLTDAIQPLGIPIAGATALFELLHLFLAHVVLF